VKKVCFTVEVELPDDVKEYRLAGELGEAVKKHARDYPEWTPVSFVVDWIKRKGAS
jgi:hypothetical protein